MPGPADTDGYQRPNQTSLSSRDAKRKWKWLIGLLILIALLAIAIQHFVETHPHVFMTTRAHCMKIAWMELLNYADAHNGRFPYHAKGYGNALLLLEDRVFHCLTGPGYDATPFLEAKRRGIDLAEEECGRVYVQGLKMRSNREIALLFDKLPTPGGDHMPFPHRLWRPLVREVCTVGDALFTVPESEWPEFSKQQVELLVAEGFQREEAERLFASKHK